MNIPSTSASTARNYVVVRTRVKPSSKFIAQEKHPQTQSYLKSDGSVNIVAKASAALKVSDSGDLAIEHTSGTNRQAKYFYANSEKLRSWNDGLMRSGSHLTLECDSTETVTFQDKNGNAKTLNRIKPRDVFHENIERQRNGETPDYSGINITIGGQCETAARDIVGPVLDQRYNPPQGVQPDDSHYRIVNDLVPGAFSAPRATDKDKIIEQNNQAAKVYGEALRELKQLRQKNFQTAKFPLEEKIEQLGINEHADPSVGQAFGKLSLGGKILAQEDPRKPEQALVDEQGNIVPAPAGYQGRTILVVKDYEHNSISRPGFGQHWGAVVAKDGRSYITLENYVRRHEDSRVSQFVPNESSDPRYYFNMYGPSDQSFHKTWNGIPNAVSVVHEGVPPITTNVYDRRAQQYFSDGAQQATAHGELTNAASADVEARVLYKALAYANSLEGKNRNNVSADEKSAVTEWKSVLKKPPAYSENMELRTYVLEKMTRKKDNLDSQWRAMERRITRQLTGATARKRTESLIEKSGNDLEP